MKQSETLINVIDGDHRYVREQHIDILDNEHVVTFTNIAIDADVIALLAQHAIDIDAQLKNSEVSEYKSDIRNGINPFTTNVLTFNTRAEMLKNILDDALSLPATDPITYNGLPYLANITDAELIALYSQTQAWVDNIRATAADLLTNKLSFDSYVPPLGVV